MARQLIKNVAERKRFDSNAGATAVGNSRDRGEVEVVSKPTARGAAAEAAPDATWRGPDAATLRVIFGSTVLLKR